MSFNKDVPSNSALNTEAQTDPVLAKYRERVALSSDVARAGEVAKRHDKGFRSARENLQDLVDPGSFIEYGQMAVAAQRSRRDYDELKVRTAADGILTGVATINQSQLPDAPCKTAVIVNDYSVLAGTQGYYHHKKLDRMIHVAGEQKLPVVMYTEGGGGRPGDTDVEGIMIGGLDLTTFSSWAALQGQVPRIAVNNGYCFAGNAALFGCSDIRIATRSSCIGMAGPAMIEGGGLGVFAPTEIGPIDVQLKNGVVDLVADDEADATRLAKKALSYFQGRLADWHCADQQTLWSLLPKDRRFTYKVREVIKTLADTDSFLELRQAYGSGIITGFIRLEGRPFGLICNDCQILGGAIDGDAAVKAARFINLCSQFKLPIVSLCDTPGFMVGPASEAQGAVAKMSELFLAGARCQSPIVTIFLRKSYGLGGMAMAGGSFKIPVYAASWPSGEFGPMGLEGGVRLGYKKELDAAGSKDARSALFNKLVSEAYERGKATEAASFLELDAVIEPAETRSIILRSI